MQKNNNIPVFVSVITFLIGCYDLVRGFMHTINLEYSARYLAGLDLTTPQAIDLLRLLDVFGISNYITGIMLILLALKARPLALIMLAVIPIAYGLGVSCLRYIIPNYPPSHALWKGAPIMLVYSGICLITFLAGLGVVLYRKHKHA
jgi:hypothetical protein